MPVEIRELHIKVTVNEAPQGEGTNRNSADRRGGSENTGADREAIVAECVEQVLRIMQNKRER
jgi:hypothetical protein